MKDNQQGSIFIKQITNVDLSVFDSELGIIGYSFHAHIKAHGILDETGFVYDFSLLKKSAQQFLKNSIDHTLVIPTEANEVSFQDMGENGKWRLTSSANTVDEKSWDYISPKGSVFPITGKEFDVEKLEIQLSKQIMKTLPVSISSIELTLEEEHIEESATSFRYTHGLPLHKGQCQRLFHGHKSRLEVYVDGKKNKSLEDYLVTDLLGQHVHIACLNQVISGHLEEGKRLHTSSSSTHLGYTSDYGRFEAHIPSSRIFTVKNVTSVETIVWQLAKHLKEEKKVPGKIKVICYEGINKGAEIEI